MTKSKNSTRKSRKRRSRKPGIPPLTWKTAWPWMAVVAAFTIFGMWPVVNADFTAIDDKELILDVVPKYHDDLRRMWRANRYTVHYKPITKMTWALEYKLFDLDARAMHVNNLVLHLLNSLLVFLVVFRIASRFDLTRARPYLTAGLAAVLFGIHPLHVESVAWAIERKDVLYTFFFLAGLLGYLRYLVRPDFGYMALVALAFSLSVLSKSAAIVFPFVLFLLDYAYGKSLNARSFISKWPVIAVFAWILFIFGVFGNPENPDARSRTGGTPEGRIASVVSTEKLTNVEPIASMPPLYGKLALLGLKSVFWYAHSWIPAGLSLGYPYRQWLPAIGGVIHLFLFATVAAGFLIFYWRKKHRFLFFTHALFFGVLSPALVRTGLGKSIFLSDRYVYVACLGVILFATGWALEYLARWNIPRKTQMGILGAACFLIALYTQQVAMRWDNGETLWTNTIEKYPGMEYPYVNRGTYYMNTGQVEKALADFSKGADGANAVESLSNRGVLLRQQGKLDLAMRDFEAILEMAPGNIYGLTGKANVLFSMGRYEEAIEVYSRGLQAAPRDVQLLSNRASSYYYLNRIDEALTDLDRAESINPDYGPIYQKKSVMYLSSGRWDEAAQNARKATQFFPEEPRNYGDLGVALQRLGRHAEAVEAFTSAIQLMPQERGFYLARAQSYDALGDPASARQDRATAQGL